MLDGIGKERNGLAAGRFLCNKEAGGIGKAK